MSYNYKNFHITLSSAGNEHLNRLNSASHFTIQLPHTVCLPPVSTYYEIGISNLILPAKYYNVTNDSNRIIVKKSRPKKDPQTFVIDSYESGQIFQIPSVSDPMTHREVARYVTSKISPEYREHFELKFVPPELDSIDEESGARFHFQIKNKAIVVLDKRDATFWQQLGVSSDRIARNLTQ